MSIIKDVFTPVKHVQENLTSIYKIAEVIESMQDAANVSLPSYIKKCSMLHRVYIQREVAAEECLHDILYNVQSMITAWALCALQLNHKVDDVRTVRKVLDVIATESYGKTSTVVSSLETLLNKYSGVVYGTEGLLDSPISTVAGWTDELHEESPLAKKDTTNSNKNTIVDIPDNVRLPSGRVINLDLNLSNKDKTTVGIWLHLLPHFIPSEVMEQFIAMNFKTTLLQRWIQLSVGEISFLKDFIAEADRRKRRMSAIKMDKHGILKDMQGHKDSSVTKSWTKIAQYRPNRQNIATSILVYDKFLFDKFCTKYNCKFDRINDRQRFFDSTFALMVVVVDSMYGTVDFYINGIDAKASYSFNQMKSQAKSDKFSLMDIMQAMSRNQAPKF